MKKQGIALSAFCLLLIAGLFIPGCGKKDDAYSVSTPGGKVTVKADGSGGQGAVQIETKDGKAVVVTGQQGGTVTEAQLGAPVYPGATVRANVKMASTDSEKGNVEVYTLLTPDGFDKVSAFYKTNLKNVKNSFVQGSGEQGMAMFTVGDDGALTITVGPGENKGTAIQVARKTK